MSKLLDVLVGVVALIVLGVCLGIGHNRFRQAPLPLWFPPPATHPWDIDLPSVREQVRLHTTVVFDARNAQRFQSGHLPGARNLPVDQASRAPSLATTRQDVIVYCDNPGCPKADGLRLLLLQQGFQQVRVFRGGIAAWNREGLLLEK